MYIEKMKAEIEKQTEKEYEFSPVRGCAQQLIDIVGDNEKMAQLVCTDFENKMTVQECEKKIKAFVDKHHKGNCGYCPPQKAEQIIREFFGLGAAENKPQAAAAPKVLRLADFL